MIVSIIWVGNDYYTYILFSSSLSLLSQFHSVIVICKSTMPPPDVWCSAKPLMQPSTSSQTPPSQPPSYPLTTRPLSLSFISIPLSQPHQLNSPPSPSLLFPLFQPAHNLPPSSLSMVISVPTPPSPPPSSSTPQTTTHPHASHTPYAD